MSQSDTSWIDTLSEILAEPVPGSGNKEQGAPKPPVIHTQAEDDASLLDQLTEVLSNPLPGAEAQAAERDDQGEAAFREAAEAADKDADPVSTTGAAGADWMQREYERFNAYQEHNRQSFAERQRYEQERFFEYQKHQIEGLNQSQLREQDVFRKHQQARFQAWRDEMQRGMRPEPGMMPPPPPPPWWRGRD